MKQAILRGPRQLVVEDVPIPALEEGEALIRVESALVCGTDLRIFDGTKTKNVSYPSVLGHEFAGTIVDVKGVGSEVPAVGERVAVYPIVPCGSCAACTRGRENICRNRMAFGYQIPGGFSEFVKVPAIAVRNGNMVPVGSLSADSAAVVEPLACALNGQLLIDTPAAKSLLIVGSGPLGLLHARLGRALGVPAIMTVDPAAHRRAAALESGADSALSPEEVTQEAVAAFTDGAGFDTVVVAVGRADAVEPYLDKLAPAARVSLFAGFPTGQDTLRLSANDIHYNEYTFVGGSSCHLSNFTRITELISSGALDAGGLVTSHLPIDAAEAAIEQARTGNDLRIAIAANA
ncbi:alcohol dehydrogenase catalytic domain-containing protein [Microcella pacifica]|jgi:2-desacetyl-2-hydroxyethyl bacteriochlorophyllide A dehydrogenase|uniref:alcohol dehydrogenase catalytic domain-containing protein n=1 Tax=Microcella pacifica TaxID=2591847 RepID=UPI003315B1BA